MTQLWKPERITYLNPIYVSNAVTRQSHALFIFIHIKSLVSHLFNHHGPKANSALAHFLSHSGSGRHLAEEVLVKAARFVIPASSCRVLLERHLHTVLVAIHDRPVLRAASYHSRHRSRPPRRTGPRSSRRSVRSTY